MHNSRKAKKVYLKFFKDYSTNMEFDDGWCHMKYIKMEGHTSMHCSAYLPNVTREQLASLTSTVNTQILNLQGLQTSSITTLLKEETSSRIGYLLSCQQTTERENQISMPSHLTEESVLEHLPSLSNYQTNDLLEELLKRSEDTIGMLDHQTGGKLHGLITRLKERLCTLDQQLNTRMKDTQTKISSCLMMLSQMEKKNYVQSPTRLESSPRFMETLVMSENIGNSNTIDWSSFLAMSSPTTQIRDGLSQDLI